MIGQHPHDGERRPAALSSKEARNRMARTIRNMRIASARVLVAFMTMLMVFGTTPAQLWAEGAEGIAQAVTSRNAEPTGEDSSTAAGADQAATEDEMPAEGADTSDSAASADTQESESQDASQPAAKVEAAAEASAKAEPAVPSDDDESDIATSADELTSDAKVYIQDSKDKNSSYSTKSGALKAGETLWANVYEGYSSVTNPGTWTYTWLAGTVKASNNVSDYTDVVGHEQSLAVTDAMVGKYFICKVTAGGKDYYGPSVSYGSGINANYIPGPVLGAGQMELYSVKLSSDAPSIGDTLMATPYKDWSSPAGSDAKVTYTWSSSASQYSGFTKIEGETGASLTVTNDLEGKYVKVEATAGVNTVSKTTSNKVKQAGAVDILSLIHI